jgi:hypothetical protein
MPKVYPVREDILSALFPFHAHPLPPEASERVLMKSATSICNSNKEYHYRRGLSRWKTEEKRIELSE